ncbi:aminodeoxychorismate/anthranilate synthase component II [uncultured Methanobrevibacter sp.]|uniref:anthranilate synthase component II n=1 Tax=uncultured Methanobrevibacter sp. TaxID=253161 RepID=UPI0025F5F9AD|nr:aminodeoxychorismate/anthranilate synthase component II [uncultured Methanobrevibacter sp.]
MILLIDNYDSFVYNLYQYIAEGLANINNYNLKNDKDLEKIYNKIKVIRNDEISLKEIEKLNPDHIILSPGPGKPKDAGICEEIVTYYAKMNTPILGVCLGHQAICEGFGSSIIKAKKLMHGKTSYIEHNDDKIFKNMEGGIIVARYHSLAVDTATLNKDLKILAKADDGEIMAVKYKDSNIYGLQFHPESVLTPDGLNIIENFLKIN